MQSTSSQKQAKVSSRPQKKQAPSQLIKDQESGKSIADELNKPRIIKHFNITDNSIYSDSQVQVDEPLFQAEPNVIRFTNYEPLQVMEQVLKLRNKDKVARSVKIVPPDSKLFQVQPCKKNTKFKSTAKSGFGEGADEDIDNMTSRIAPGMEISFIIKFSPEAKSDYSYDLNVLTERERFIVPIRAVGCRAMIDFPDVLDFGQVPVKHITEKPVMIRNIGEKTTKWTIKAPAGFQLNKHEGILEIGASEQLIFKFIPQEARSYKDEMTLYYDNLEAVVPITGESHNDKVFLSKSHIHMDPTSITLYSHQYYTIVNKSQVPIEFSWRAFSTEKEENEKKSRLNQQLIQEEGEERQIMESQDLDGSDEESLDSDDSYDENEMQLKRQRYKEKAIASLQRKYQGIRKAVDDDPMLFQDEIFTIEPLQGKIWPNTEITCCVTFRPQGPYHYSCTAFCNTTCSEERLALNMTGQGKGPQAQLSLPEQDIGDIFVNFEREFPVGIENTGEIDCHWKLIPYETPFGSKFHFSKTEGILGVNQNVRDLIKVTFKSDILGEFSETFRFALEGSSEMLTLTFKGHVVAPTFKFSEEIIEFGRVSYKFPNHKTVFLKNTSEVDINYVIRVPSDGPNPTPEFQILNDRGCLEKGKQAQIEITFIPSKQQVYDMVLVVDLEGVGQDMLAVPIKADCKAPTVTINPNDYLEYDKCFLKHPKTQEIEIINNDNLLAKYEILPQDDQTKRIAVFTASQTSGVIQPKSKEKVQISLRTEIITKVHIALYIKVEGQQSPFMLTITADSRGPTVEADQVEIDWGNVTVLKDITKTLRITNKSKIQAEYTAFTKLKESIWKVIQRYGKLEPNEEREIEIVCVADEVIKFQDTLHIIINNGQDLEVALRAKGTGSTLFCKQDLSEIDFKTKYTHQGVTEEFFLENRGRRTMTIEWARTTKMTRKDKNKPAADSKKGDDTTKKSSGGSEVAQSVAGATDTKEEEESKFVFSVTPDKISLGAKMGYRVQFKANSNQVGESKEEWVCSTTIQGERKPKQVIFSKVIGNFIMPSIVPSEQKLNFVYTWEKGVASRPISKPLTIQNSGPLATTITLKIDPPFSCPTEKLTLNDNTPEIINIDFDPGAQNDRLSDILSGKLTISHEKHNHKDYVNLSGQLCFPNLNIVPPNIDFGCILNDTSKKKYLVLTNPSKMAVNYEWSFLEEEQTNLNTVAEEEEGRKKKKKSKVLPINEVFDILPVSGRLMPGQSENVEFTFQAGHGLLYNGIAVCSVDGGPDYEVPILGESSFVDFKLSTQSIDFGAIDFMQPTSGEFTIENIGKVPFEFNINLSTLSRPGIVTCGQMNGKVLAGDKLKVPVTMHPGVPDDIQEMFLVECGHFPAVRFNVKAVGIYPGCLLSFPRIENFDYQSRMSQVKQRLQDNKLSYSKPFDGKEALELLPAPPQKIVDKKILGIKDTEVLEVEAEADREILCEKIIQGMKQAQQSRQDSGNQLASLQARSARNNRNRGSKSSAADDVRSAQGISVDLNVEQIPLATYVCDFGNVVFGNPEKKSFRLTNCGGLPVQFLPFKKEALSRANVTIEAVDKNQKIAPGHSTYFMVQFSTRKNKYGKMKEIVPLQIKGGPQYDIEFRANLTIPEVSMSSETLDFGKVCVQTRKTIKVRFENRKEVACIWKLMNKPEISSSAAEGERFQITPTQGTLAPGQRQTVDVMFTPNLAGQMSQKLNFKIDDNPKLFNLNLKGHGIHYQVDLSSENAVLHLGSVLPYAEGAVKSFELKNPMEQAIEVVSVDFDKKYIEEEEILRRLEQFNQPTAVEPLFMPLRLPGQEFWQSLKEQDEKRQRTDDLKAQLLKIENELADLLKEESALNEEKAPDEQENTEEKPPQKTQEEISDRRNELTTLKCDIELKLSSEKEQGLEIKHPQPVKEHDKLNILIVGPESSGKSTLANYLAQEHQRTVLKVDQLYDWCLKRGNDLSKRVTEYMEERQTALAAALEEQSKRKKPKKGEVVEQVNEDDYKKLSDELQLELIRDRLAQEDCNAGAIFDGLKAEVFGNEKEVIDKISQAVPIQNLQVLLFKFQKDKEEEESVPVATNYRLAKRRMQTRNIGTAGTDERAVTANQSPDKKAVKKVKSSRPKAGKTVAKTPTGALNEEDKFDEALESERKMKEDADRKRKEDEARALQRPKDYTDEELEEYEKFVEDFEQSFGELTVRCLNDEDKKEEEPQAEDEKSQKSASKHSAAAEEEKKEEDGEENKDPEEPQPKVVYGKRVLVPISVEYDFQFLCDSTKMKVPEPLWPDPDKEPLPEPTVSQIVRKPATRAERQEITMYSIWTPTTQDTSRPPSAAGDEEEKKEEEGAEGEQNAEPKMTNEQTRWIIPPKESVILYIKFFSEEVGEFPQTLNFEIVGSTRNFPLHLKSLCSMPTINTNYKNVFMNHKRVRPPTMPESYLDKTYVVAEGVFDFGPLLIGKDGAKREEDTSMKAINSSEIRITNNGQFDVEASFVLKSSLPQEEGGPGEPGPFILEPETMTLKKDETQNLTVWSFPTEAKQYRDEIVCLLKDNPNPSIFPVQALGAKPVVDVDQDVVEFDRLLLGKKLQKTLTLKNNSSIPANWKLSGIDELPEEFIVDCREGKLAPCAEQVINITFQAKEEKILDPTISLEVEDTEGRGVQQEVKPIKLQAEAFKISPTVIVGKDDAQTLDYGSVRVGEPRENQIIIKNEGKYPIKYNFQRKKKLTREIFKVEPEEDELQPGAEKTIVVRFLTQKEIKLKTATQNTDMILNILEGATQEIHQPIPINVNVNAEFSKYTITPLKTINFGPMQYGAQETRSFEIRNDGLFEFKYSVCDFNDKEAKAKIREERQKEIDERINGAQEAAAEDPKKAAGKAPAKDKGKPGAKGAAKDEPAGDKLIVGQYEVTPSTGSIPPGQSGTLQVQFNAEGAKFYETTLAVDIADRDPMDNPDGLPFELCAESSIPGINTEDLDQIFEEQTVIPTLDPQLNTQTIITSSLYSQQERVFWFGTLVASKNPEGVKERFKIMNPNKIPCKVNFAVKPRNQSKSEGFAFKVTPDNVSIDPHKHKYVTVSFHPTSMMAYGGIFEAQVENGDANTSQGLLQFELRGEGTLPTLFVEKPNELDTDGTPLLKFRRTRIGRDNTLQIVLKNEGQVPAIARFDAMQNSCFDFKGTMSHTITPKNYQAFDIIFKPKQAGKEEFLLTFQTMGNPYEQHKVMLVGEGYSETVTFEGLPNDELKLGDCIINKAKQAAFQLANNGEKPVRFSWNAGVDGFKFYPNEGHLKPHSRKEIKVQYKSEEKAEHNQIELMCDTQEIVYQQGEEGAKEDIAPDNVKDWDDNQKTVRMVRPSELARIQQERRLEEARKKEEAENAALIAKGQKPKPKGKNEAPPEEEIQVDMSEDPTEEFIDTIKPPEFKDVEGSDALQLQLKTSLVCDYARYECATTRLDFKPTLMYAQRTHKFTIKNTSLINLNFNFKISNPNTGMLDAGAFSIFPKRGSIAPGCDDNFMVKFAPMEVDNSFLRKLSSNFQYLDPEQQPLEIMSEGVAERPIIHFELPPSSYRERKEKDMTPIDSKFKIIEFDSLGTLIKNTRRFMAVNPTGQGYEFEWEEVQEEAQKRSKPLFKCLTTTGLILSGKKFEMAFEYVPDTVGEHEAKYIFRIPKMNVVQHFLVVGRVNEPNVLFNTGKIKFGPLLLSGKNREVVQLINQEQIPFSFNFAKEAIKGSTDYGDSLRVTPQTGTVPAGSEIPVEVLFQPKYELNYNYNLICNIKRKARPLVLNVKGEGYKIHHSVLAGSTRVEMQPGEPHKFEFGEFFINERKTKKVVLVNKGEFNFDFVWRRQVNPYLTITPETGSVTKGAEVEFEITYLPINEHALKNFKMQLQIISGPKYDFVLVGKARKPGIKLSQTVVDFGPCFVSRNPMPLKRMLVMQNLDQQAISVETDFEKLPHLDLNLVPGTVLMPESDNDKDAQSKIEIPIMFTPREMKTYQEKVTFDFNNLYKVDVIIKGEGIPLQLELQDPDQGFIDYGVLSVGQDVTRTVPLINRSKKPVTFKLKAADPNGFQKCNLSIMPDKEVTLKPREVKQVEVRFNPKTRLPDFNHNILLEVEPNEPRKLISLHGVSHGIELKLMDEVVTFGSVVKGSRLTKTLQLSNFGDVKAFFKWDNKSYKQNFTIAPEQGFIPPNSNLDLEITFHPQKSDLDLHIKSIPCAIKGGEELKLSLMGKSVELDASEDQELQFTTKVRQANVLSVDVNNTEGREWAINPTISTELDETKGFFTGSSRLTVPANGKATYEITYQPTIMTKMKKIKKKNDQDEEVEEEVMNTHKATLFFPLPNGTALLYKLSGTATEPDAQDNIEEKATAKKVKSLIIPMKNWSRASQRFKAKMTFENEKDPACFISGASTFDVGGHSTKHYKLSFLSLKSGNYKFEVKFMNEKTGEYAFYNVSVDVEEPEDPIQTIDLVSQVRESVSHVVNIENPTDLEVTIPATEVTCENEDIEILPSQLVIPPRSERGFEVKYRPLVATEDVTTDLVIQNSVLGQFKFRLVLRGQNPNFQRSLAFKCALGGEILQNFKFTHYLKKATNYAVKVERVDNPGQPCDFKAEVAQVTAPAAENNKGVELQAAIKYEPFTIGDSRGVLKLTSPEGIEYTCMLYGKSIAPQPQGPVRIQPGKPEGIEFKNPLNEKQDFIVTFDNQNFTLQSKPPQGIDPGKPAGIQVKFEGKADLPNTGRMIITAKGLPPWVYYLVGGAE